MSELAQPYSNSPDRGRGRGSTSSLRSCVTVDFAELPQALQDWAAEVMGQGPRQNVLDTAPRITLQQAEEEGFLVSFVNGATGVPKSISWSDILERPALVPALHELLSRTPAGDPGDVRLPAPPTDVLARVERHLERFEQAPYAGRRFLLRFNIGHSLVVRNWARILVSGPQTLASAILAFGKASLAGIAEYGDDWKSEAPLKPEHAVGLLFSAAELFERRSDLVQSALSCYGVICSLSVSLRTGGADSDAFERAVDRALSLAETQIGPRSTQRADWLLARAEHSYAKAQASLSGGAELSYASPDIRSAERDLLAVIDVTQGEDKSLYQELELDARASLVALDNACRRWRHVIDRCTETIDAIDDGTFAAFLDADNARKAEYLVGFLVSWANGVINDENHTAEENQAVMAALNRAETERESLPGGGTEFLHLKASILFMRGMYLKTFGSVERAERTFDSVLEIHRRVARVMESVSLGYFEESALPLLAWRRHLAHTATQARVQAIDCVRQRGGDAQKYDENLPSLE